MKAIAVCLFLGFGVGLATTPAWADSAPPGFVEPIVQWGVQKGETCEDIAKALYGSATHVALIGRYNRVVCAAGKTLPEGLTLILPKSVTTVPDARVKTSHPDVRGRPSGGSWSNVQSGAPLYRNHNVQTMDEGRAHIEFLDHTHVFLAQNTLIVVYGTASNTRVSKVAPTIELQAGEVQAGLSALRGEPALVAVPDGGRVSALSNDTVVERKATRTTIAVFEGKATVESAGKTVAVPKHFGTRFVGNTPPAPPRPLPPAPQWQAAASSAVVMAPAGMAVITMNWAAVPKAKAYRFEVARDDDFHDLVVREEIPADVLSFRAERFPAGSYRLRVRAIDDEEYLGIASDVRRIEVISADLRGEGGRSEGGKLVANPYGQVTFATQPGLDVALDNGPFAPIPSEIDLLRQAPKSLRIRTTSGQIETIAIEYTTVKATPTGSFNTDKRILNVRVEFAGAGNIDVVQRIAPQLRVHLGDHVQTLPLTAQSEAVFTSEVVIGDTSGDARLDITDDRGRLLGTNTVSIPEKPIAPPAAPPALQRIGLKLPSPRPMGVTGRPWSAPTAPTAAGIGISGGVTANGLVLQGNVRASGALGKWGIDALVQSPALEPSYSASADSPPTESVAWLGARYRMWHRGNAQVEVAPTLRVGLPMVWSGQPWRLDVGGAVGGARGSWTWLANAGGIFALGGDSSLTPRFSPYLLAGGTYDIREWLRAYAIADVNLMIARDGRDVIPFGLSGGIEIGRQYFASLGGWVGRAESVELTWAAVGVFSVGLHMTEAGR